MVTFTINGTVHTTESSQLSLAQYIREVALLTGTKVSCGEGGCGACIVTVTKTEGGRARSVNCCLTPVNICEGWQVTTVEGLGGRSQGYHPIQQSLAANGGTQCGYCSPGMVMQLHSFLQEHPQPSQLEIEKIIDGNICRCTGYRPILDTLKQFAADTSGKTQSLLQDIEDLTECRRSGGKCAGVCQSRSSCHGRSSSAWHQPASLTDLLQILAGFSPDTKYRLVAGNTGTGVYKREEESYDAFVNINNIADLKVESESPMYLGGNVSITDAIHYFARAGNSDPKWTEISKHLANIANLGIRNQGTLAGNLMMKHAHPDFPSDVFVCLETLGATLELLDSGGAVEEISVESLLGADMTRRLIKTIKFPAKRQVRSVAGRVRVGRMWMRAGPGQAAGATHTFLKTFKIMPRSSNAHAYVNAGFLANVDIEKNYEIVGAPTIVYGGISSNLIHARKTEQFLEGKNMTDHGMFMAAIDILETEIIPDMTGKPGEYRKQLGLSLFYKFFLHVLGRSASPAVQTGAEDLSRGLTSGQQSFDTDESVWPVSQPRQKVEASWQTAGEIQYTADLPARDGELHGAFVLSTRANCDVLSVDPTEALALPGVVDFVTANDIPGENRWNPFGEPQELFLTGKSFYAGQSVGLIVAETREIAEEAARRVKMVHGNEGPVVCDLELAMETPNNIEQLAEPAQYGDVAGSMSSADMVLQGRFRTGEQYHFYMETQVCVVTPVEDGFDVELATQDIQNTQTSVARVMNLSDNSINVTVKRLGGGFGGKGDQASHLATAATVAANKLNRPVRIWLPLEDNVKLLGKRNQYLFDYKLGLTSDGTILALDLSAYSQGGQNMNGADSFYCLTFAQSAYNIPSAKITPYGVMTHTASPSAMRAPGNVNQHAVMETLMEHAAAQTGFSPDQIRMKNLIKEGDPVMPPDSTLAEPSPLPQMIADLKVSGDYETRLNAARAFNLANRWKKRGISLVPMRYDHFIGDWIGVRFNCVISVFGGDGSVSVAHGGVEMGQGLNTKVVQVVAYELGIDVSMVKIKPVRTVTNPNGFQTGGSVGSESNCVAAQKACAILKERLAPVREELGPDATWQEVIQTANTEDIDLCARYMFEVKKDNYPGYNIWGLSLTEVELDVLTGEMRVVRTDLVEDAGLSTSPAVDIGQVEGAFVMGLGLWTSEEVRYDTETGELLTCNSWEYKPPAAKDIPQDFRVTLLRNARNPVGALSSKAIGEPPICLGVSVLSAIRDGLNSCRQDLGLQGWWQLDGPATVEKIREHTGVNKQHFIF